jgi:hypothetical protein
VNGWNNNGPPLHEDSIYKTQRCVKKLITTNSIEQSPSWQAGKPFIWSRNSPHFMEPKEGSLSCSQESNTGIQFTISHTISTITLTLSSHLYLCLPSNLLPSGFQITLLYKFFISSNHVICPVHLTPLHLIIVVIFHSGKSKN